MVEDQEEYYDYDSEYYKYDDVEKTQNSVCKDSNGNVLQDGDAVTLTQDLKVKGTSVNLKRGTLIKNIRITDNPEEIECHAEKVKNLVLKTKFLKKH
ncbi:MAG TPA: alkylphosphonate utilization protein [Haliscomenobacter sp.]|nr:alkylphosphonate utilization protein [Haliscomenobacter sp.]HOY21030.1 alkylphosphonate utilization protein [Haliscomenobacter sp.]HPH21762.1 alkylphosphonate utilization protein [Haliscomenobacter sp.]